MRSRYAAIPRLHLQERTGSWDWVVDLSLSRVGFIVNKFGLGWELLWQYLCTWVGNKLSLPLALQLGNFDGCRAGIHVEYIPTPSIHSGINRDLDGSQLSNSTCEGKDVIYNSILLPFSDWRHIFLFLLGGCHLSAERSPVVVWRGLAVLVLFWMPIGEI